MGTHFPVYGGWFKFDWSVNFDSFWGLFRWISIDQPNLSIDFGYIFWSNNQTIVLSIVQSSIHRSEDRPRSEKQYTNPPPPCWLHVVISRAHTHTVLPTQGAMVVIAANAGGAWSPVGDVTTTMLWITDKITAGSIIVSLFIPSLVSLLVPLFVMYDLVGGGY